MPETCLPTALQFLSRSARLGTAAVLCLLAAGSRAAEPADAIVTSAFIYEEAEFPSCHASTLAYSQGRLVAAWFGGTDEGNPDVGIWVARQDARSADWSRPVEVVNGVESADRRYPCWNPVLFQYPDGPLMLFYKVGPNPRQWWGMVVSSADGGASWSQPTRLPDGIYGPIKNKPVLLGERLLCGSSTEDEGWRVHMEWTPDQARTWERTEPLNDGRVMGAIQPTILQLGPQHVKILCRSRGVGSIVESTSSDGGRTWTPVTPTSLPNPNSGIDGVTMRDGRHVLVYNHTPRGRSPLNVAVSPDGKQWFAALVLEREPGEYSYPAVIQAPDGRLHISYTWRREKIRHVVVDPEEFRLREIVDGVWPEP